VPAGGGGEGRLDQSPKPRRARRRVGVGRRRVGGAVLEIRRRSEIRPISAERDAEVKAAGRTCRLPDPPGQEPRECKCLLPEGFFSRLAPPRLRKCLECCGAAAALLAEPRFLPKKSDDAWYPTPKALARVANTVTAGFEPGKSPFPRVYDLERDFTPDATKVRNKNRAKSSKSAGA
jgi:hypothetical protein